MLNLVACDPNVRLINIFHLIDEPALEGWQSGIYFADQTPKQSAAVVKSFVAGGSKCLGKSARWVPAATATVATIPAALPRGCVAACAKSWRAVTARCQGAKAAKAPCLLALAALRTEIAVLQRQSVHVKGAAKTLLAAQIAAIKKALGVGASLASALAH